MYWAATSAQARIRTRSGGSRASVDRARRQRRLAVCPDALLERAAQLGAVGLAYEVRALVVEGRVEEEPLVLDFEVLLRLANPALSEGDELLTFGERADGHRPFLESNRHH